MEIFHFHLVLNLFSIPELNEIKTWSYFIRGLNDIFICKAKQKVSVLGQLILRLE